MTAGRWQRVKIAFEAARASTGDARRQYLASLSESDPEIVEELRDLLAAYDESESFLATAPMQNAMQADFAASGLTLLGRRLGAYRLVQLVGVGGMGEVYRAERVDGEFEQQVAIKVVRQSADEASLARFRTERQILANLSHPHIARIYDGGTTEAGEPYLVMELIEGLRIDEYCKLRDPNDAERLRLLITICAAVDYAHQQHILHRDIKPANIMVSGDGSPQLLDFGIAKLLATPEDRTQTATQARALTPGYASPEQLWGAALTTASDVFSLGVIAHEVLTGTRFRPDASTAQTGGRPVSPEIRRILRKATASEPRDRYSSAAAMSAALQGVLMGSPRRRVALTAVGVLLAAVLGLLWWRPWSPPPAGRSIAVIEIENLTQDASLDWMDRGVSELLATGLAQSDQLEVISTEHIRGLMARRINAREVASAAHAQTFVTGALMRVGERFRLDVKVQDTSSGRVLLARNTEGDNAQALFQMADEAAAALVRELGGSLSKRPDSGQLLTQNVEALKAYTEGMRLMGRFHVGEAIAKFNAATKLDPHFAMAHYRIAAAVFWWNWKACLDETRQAAGIAENLSFPRSQALHIRVLREVCEGQAEQAQTTAQTLVSAYPRDAEAWVSLAGALNEQGDIAGGLAAVEKGLAIEPDNPALLAIGWWLTAYSGDFARAMQYTARYQAILESGDVNGLDMKGDTFAMFGRLDEAAAVYQEEKRPDKEAFVALRQGKYDLAEALFRRDLDALPTKSVARGGRTGFLGDVQIARGDLAGAVSYFEEGARLYGYQFWFGADVLWKAAQVYLEQGRPEKLSELADRQSSPWRSGFRGIANLLAGRPEQADVEFAALRTSISQVLGDARATQYEKLYRGIAAAYGGKSPEAIELLAGLPLYYRALSALPLGKAYLQKGDVAAAQREFDFAVKSQGIWGVPGWYEHQDMLTLLLAHYYLGEILERQGKRDAAIGHYREFASHFQKAVVKLPQADLANAAIVRLR